MKRYTLSALAVLSAVAVLLVGVGSSAGVADAGDSFPIKPVNGPEYKTVEVKGINKNKLKITICERDDCQSAKVFGGDVRLALSFAGVKAFSGVTPTPTP